MIVSYTLDAGGEVLEVGGHCGLYVDLASGEDAPIPGDWVATKAGSRYLVDHVRAVRRRKPGSRQERYQLRVLRLPRHADPPADVHVIWLHWYPRARRT